ncbi:MAG: NusG domain II-containing protein [Alkalispirochaeta sp.]
MSALRLVLKMLRPADIVIILMATATIGSVSHFVYAGGGVIDGGTARIRSDDTTWLYPLDRERVVVPLEQAGTCEITISDGTVGVTASDCPQKICISMGNISRPNQWIACLPHGVLIDVVGVDPDPEVDAYAF